MEENQVFGTSRASMPFVFGASTVYDYCIY